MTGGPCGVHPRSNGDPIQIDGDLARKLPLRESVNNQAVPFRSLAGAMTSY